MPSFVVVPQWQGSGSDRAMRLIDGAEAIRGDLPSAHTTTVEVPAGAGDSLGTGIARVSSLRTVHERLREHLVDLPGPAITIGGDCSVSLAAVGHAWEHSAGSLAVVWLDAHPDLNTPESSPSGAFTGMVLRALLGEGTDGLVAPVPLVPARVILAGTRDIDPGEQDAIDDLAIPVLAVGSLDADSLVAAIAATGATSVYLHIDLDVLDPAEIEGLGSPVPFGLTVAELTALIRAALARFEFAGASVTEFAPTSPAAAGEDMGAILRIIGALAA